MNAPHLNTNFAASKKKASDSVHTTFEIKPMITKAREYSRREALLHNT